MGGGASKKRVAPAEPEKPVLKYIYSKPTVVARQMSRQLTTKFSNGLKGVSGLVRLGAGSTGPTWDEESRKEADAEATAEILSQLEKYCKLVRSIRAFSDMGVEEVEEAARHCEIKHFNTGEMVYDEEALGHDCYIVEKGVLYAQQRIWCVHIANKKEWREMRTYKPGNPFGERNLLRSEPRQARMMCRTDATLVRVVGSTFVRCARITERKQDLIRRIDIFETMTDDQLSKLAALLSRRTYAEGEALCTAGEAATCLFILEEGAAVASNSSSLRYVGASENVKGAPYAFPEKALVGEPSTYEHTVVAAAHGSSSTGVVCYVLYRAEVEARLGKTLDALHKAQFEADPRKLLADFYMKGNGVGPAGTLKARRVSSAGGAASPTGWFAVYRPCSRDSIAKMLGQFGVGKGLNIKGKSAKKNRLSGFVPFLQISSNNHKALIEESPFNARCKVFYRNVMARQHALSALTDAMRDVEGKIEDMNIYPIDDFEPSVFGLDVPEKALVYAYIHSKDISPVIGWETGRASEPAFMDMNLHSIRGGTVPAICLYQFDLADPMNPLGLLMAYQEEQVKPVISDFDTFTVGSKGMSYNPVPPEQVKLIHWMLDHAASLLAEPNEQGWMSRWLGVLKAEAARGFHPTLPRFGFGDPTSYDLIGDAVQATVSCGAVRHGAECFNFMFPQDLDEEFLVVWDGFTDPPWQAHSEPELRSFLLARAKEGYSFPLNPVWPVRDPGWAEVLAALQSHAEGVECLKAWYPADAGVLDKIKDLHAKHPKGFATLAPSPTPPGKLDRHKRSNMALLQTMDDLSSLEVAGFVEVEMNREIQKRWRRIRHALLAELRTRGSGKKE